MAGLPLRELEDCEKPTYTGTIVATVAPSRHDSSLNLETQVSSPQIRGTLKSVCLVLTCTIAMIVNSSNNTAVSISLPTIGQDLNILETKLQWLVSSYSLSSGCLLLVCGRLADLYGRKKLFLVGIVLLGAFSIGCSFTQNEVTLDILRGMQGIGGAAIIPASIGILAHAFPPSRARSLAFATFSAGSPVGAAFGMILGGVVTDLSEQTWRSIFYISAGLAALCFIGALISFDTDEHSKETDKRVDWLGAFLVTAGLVLLFFVLSQGEIAPQQWATPYIIVLLIVGVLLIVLFVFWQLHLEHVQSDLNASYSSWTPPPLLKMSLWVRGQGRVAAMMWIAFLNWSSFLSWNFWVQVRPTQLYYQDYVGYSPIRTMVRMLPMFVTGVICNAIVAVLVGKVPLVYLIASGTICTSVANLLFALIIPSAPYWAFGFPSAIVAVVGADFVFAGGTIFVAKMVAPHEQSVAGALFQTMTQIGTALGLTVTTIIFDRVLERQAALLGVITDTASDAPKPAQLKSYHAAHWGAFAFGVIAVILTIVSLRGIGVVGHPTKPQDDEDRTATSKTDMVSNSFES